jgi:hypothetical protein
MTKTDTAGPAVSTLIESVRRHAAAQGLSIAELCFYADVAYSTWHRWTTGHALPRIANIERLLATKAPKDRRRAQ